MSIDPVKIPQNVYIEDRIVGPLTLRQTIIMTLGGGFSYMLYAMLQKTYGALSIPVTVMAWIPCAVAVLFALVKINDLSLLRICLLLIERMNKSSVRTWTPRQGISINVRLSSTPTVASPQPAAPAAPAAQYEARIRELSALIDQPSQATPVAVNTPASAPVATTPTPSAPKEMIELEEEAPPTEPKIVFPVDRSRIGVDGSIKGASDDLSVFRDVFPSSPEKP